MPAAGTQAARTRVDGRTPGTRIDWPRTLLGKANNPLNVEHLRFRPRKSGAGVLHCLLLDCSASMLRGENLALAKGLLLHWTRQIYRQRGELAVVGFSGRGARILQPPRKAVAFSERWIEPIAGGGGSPVAAAVELADELLRTSRRRNPGMQIGLWLLSDCRFRELPAPPTQTDFRVVVDFDNQAIALGRAAQLAQAWQAELLHAGELAVSQVGPGRAG